MRKDGLVQVLNCQLVGREGMGSSPARSGLFSAPIFVLGVVWLGCCYEVCQLNNVFLFTIRIISFFCLRFIFLFVFSRKFLKFPSVSLQNVYCCHTSKIYALSIHNIVH